MASAERNGERRGKWRAPHDTAPRFVAQPGMEVVMRQTSILVGLMVVMIVACGEQPLAVPEAELAAARTVRTVGPGPDDPGMPFYARLEPDRTIFHDGGWAAVVFYRDPACVPEEFNLFDFFDAPAAFGCTQLVRNASIWSHGFGVGAPKIVTAVGLGAVPVWFVPAAALLAAAEAGELTVGSLAAMTGLVIGYADRFNEVLHPHPLPVPPPLEGGGHPNPKITITAHGTTDDGRAFQLQIHRDDRGARTRIMLR
jgi:hypothetical protein